MRLQLLSLLLFALGLQLASCIQLLHFVIQLHPTKTEDMTLALDMLVLDKVL
jgi:hypothetical protein